MIHQFDELAKALAEGVSRREALRRIGGGLAGALFVSLGWTRVAWGDTRAACKSLCGGMGKNGKQCMDVCLSCPSATSVCGPAGAKTCCGGGHVCISGTCQCPSGTAVCGGNCVDTTSDRNNCGGCGTQCSTYEVCNSGVCACTKTVCLSDFGSTTYVCVDTDTDPRNCGGCAWGGGTGMLCASGVCVGGQCVCQQGWSACGPGCCPPQLNGYPLQACQPFASCRGGYNCSYGNGGNTCVQ